MTKDELARAFVARKPGWAYTVTDQRTGENFFVQDEAADALQVESNDFENEEVLAQYMEAMGE